MAHTLSRNQASAENSSDENSPSGRSPASGRGKIYKSLKWGMLENDGTILETFQILKDLGYDGVEFGSPTDMDLKEVRAASEATEMPVHGVVHSSHWKMRLSSPDASIRDQGRRDLEQALRDTKYLGGHSVLLVPGQVAGSNETHEDVWNRSIAEIRRVLPLASHLGVRVLIENVWNGFCETPEQLRDYIDEIASPWVGVYFDIGNVVKFSPSENWIRVLGPRIVKLDVKDWGVSGGFGKIGDGDVNWPAVREALAEIGFSGWSTAEVAGGDRQRVAEIASRMDRALGL